MQSGNRRIQSITPYMFILPSILIILAFLGFPVVYNIIISFFQWDLKLVSKPFIGLQNYIKVISDDKFFKIVITTLLWTGIGVVLQMILGIAIALLVENNKILKKILQSTMLLPWIIPGVITALMWGWMLQTDTGIINHILMSLGLIHNNILWIGDVKFALATVIFVNTWKATPFWFLMILAALQDIPRDQIESARIDGARYSSIVKNVIFPNIKPVIAATGILSTIWTLNYFDVIWTMTRGGPMDATSTLPIYTYRLGFEFFNFGQSAALAVITLLIIGFISIPYMRAMITSLREGGNSTL